MLPEACWYEKKQFYLKFKFNKRSYILLKSDSLRWQPVKKMHDKSAATGVTGAVATEGSGS